MIKLAVFLALVAVAYSRSAAENFGYEIRTQCISELNIEGQDLGLLREQLNNEYSDIIPALKCFYKCINEKMHLADSNAVITPREYILFLISKAGTETPTEDEIQEEAAIINTCAYSNLEDLCERSFNIVKCVKREWLNKP